jgi:menaquinone-dependent protoporphyrinogen oxidase
MTLPRVLVLFGTATGHTRKIASALAETLWSSRIEVDVVNAQEPLDPTPLDYAAVIVAAPVRAGQYPKAVRRWVTSHADELRRRPAAFVSVCLGVLEHNPKTDAVLDGILQRFFEQTGWRPATVKIVAGALPYTQYNWLTRWVMRRIVARAHGDVDTSRDYEYTDWQDLRDFAGQFVGGLKDGPARIAS